MAREESKVERFARIAHEALPYADSALLDVRLIRNSVGAVARGDEQVEDWLYWRAENAVEAMLALVDALAQVAATEAAVPR